MRTRCFIGVFSLFCLLSSSIVLAQPKRKLSAEESKKATRLFEDAEAFYDVGDFEKALEAYKASYLITRAPELLFNIGQCNRQLDRPEEALRAYRSFLDDFPEDNRNLRVNVQKIIKELEVMLVRRAKEEPTPPESLPATTVTGPDNPPSDPPRSVLRFAIPGVFAVTGLAFGGSAFLLRNKIEQEQEVDAATLTRGKIFSVAADVAFVGAGVTLLFALLPKKSKKESHLSLSMFPHGPGLVFTYQPTK